MRDLNGTHVMVTPSVLYSEESAVAAIDGGEGGFLHVRTDGVTNEDGVDVQVFAYSIYDSNGDLVDRGHGLHGPRFNRESTAMTGMRALLSFLLACAESKSEDSENYSLFSTVTREWAEMNSDELSMIHEEVCEEIGA